MAAGHSSSSSRPQRPSLSPRLPAGTERRRPAMDDAMVAELLHLHHDALLLRHMAPTGAPMPMPRARRPHQVQHHSPPSCSSSSRAAPSSVAPSPIAPPWPAPRPLHSVAPWPLLDRTGHDVDRAFLARVGHVLRQDSPRPFF